MMENEKGLSTDVTNTVVTESEKTQGKSQAVSVDTAETPPKLGIRHLQAFLLFFGNVMSFGLRSNLAVGIVSMIDNSANQNFEKYDWNESVRGIIFSSFFWGYVISPFPAGLLSQHFGPKILLIISGFMCSLATLLSPVATSFGWQYLCAARVVLGLFQGFFTPCYYALISKWVHPSERGFLVSFIFAGGSAGTVIILPLSGFVASSKLGWPGIFYLSGGFAFIWTIFFVFLGSNTPRDNKMISKMEQYFIESMPGNLIHRSSAIPWSSIFTSKPYLALVIAHCAQNWGYYTLLSQIPTFIKEVFRFDIQTNSLLSALPYLVFLILSLTVSRLSDILINGKYVSIQKSRKIFNTVGMWFPAICLIGLAYVSNENIPLAISLLTLAVGLNCFNNVGFIINFIDLSPNYAGILMGFSQCCGNVMSLMGPLFVGFVVHDASDPILWRVFFFITAGYFFVGNLVFIVFGKGVIQSWNQYKNGSVE